MTKAHNTKSHAERKAVSFPHHTKLFESVEKYLSLTEPEKEFLAEVFQVKTLKKKQFLLQEGDQNLYSNFVTEGILRLYAIDKNGYEHAIQFAPEGWWISDMHSFLKHQPANLYIDAVEDAVYLQAQWQDVQRLYQLYPRFEKYFRQLAENSIAAYQQRLAVHLSLSARERYGCFCQLYPSLIGSLPQKHIASYIGVTPEFLSKMLNSPYKSGE
jgi:CRP-like cAMP-binding protein